MCLYFIRQLPMQYDVRLDSDIFLSAFSTDVNGRRQAVSPWALAPGWRSVQIESEGDGDVVMSTTDQGTLRQSALDQWNRYCAKYSSHLPFCVGEADPVSIDMNGVICGRENVDVESEVNDQTPASKGNVQGRYAYTFPLIILCKARKRNPTNEGSGSNQLTILMMTLISWVSIFL